MKTTITERSAAVVSQLSQAWGMDADEVVLQSVRLNMKLTRDGRDSAQENDLGNLIGCGYTGEAPGVFSTLEIAARKSTGGAVLMIEGAVAKAMILATERGHDAEFEIGLLEIIAKYADGFLAKIVGAPDSENGHGIFHQWPDGTRSDVEAEKRRSEQEASDLSKPADKAD